MSKSVKFSSKIRRTYVGSLLRILLEKKLLDMGHLQVEDLGILTLRDTITEVVDVLRKLALAHLLDPLREEEAKHTVDVLLSDHLHSVSIGLDRSSITTSNSVERHSHCCHRCLRTARGSVGNVGAWGNFSRSQNEFLDFKTNR
jgi:hypothetical protein